MDTYIASVSNTADIRSKEGTIAIPGSYMWCVMTLNVNTVT